MEVDEEGNKEIFLEECDCMLSLLLYEFKKYNLKF